MTLRADADFEECADCGASFPLREVSFPETDEQTDRNTQFSWLTGQCPRCGADLQLAYDRVRNAFLPPTLQKPRRTE